MKKISSPTYKWGVLICEKSTNFIWSTCGFFKTRKEAVEFAYKGLWSCVLIARRTTRDTLYTLR